MTPLVAILGCTGGEACPYEVTVEAAEGHANIPVLSLSGEVSGSARVDWESEDGRSGTAPEAAATEAFALYGVPSLKDFSWTLEGTDDAGGFTCSGEATNGSGGSGTPSFDVTVHDEDRVSAERYWLAVLPGTPSTLFIMDREGEVFWHLVLDEELVGSDVRFLRGTNELVYNQFAEDHRVDLGALVRLGLDGTGRAELTTPNAHHAFDELEDGTLAILAIDVRPTELYQDVVGDAVYETSWEGGETRVWSVWDALEPSPRADWDSPFYPQGKDWTHGNALVWSEARQTYMVSLGGIDTVFEVGRDGTVAGSYGSEGATPVGDAYEAFNFQHDAHFNGDRLRLTTSSAELDDQRTWGVEYELDSTAGELVEVATWGKDRQDYARVLGQLRELENGNMLMSWGSGGVMREYTPDGDVVWEVYTEASQFFGNGVMFSDFYDPWTGAHTL